MLPEKKLFKNAYLILGLSFVGWILSLYSHWHRAKLLSEGSVGEAFCNISSKISCDTVAMSSYSEFMGVSVAVFGLAFFSFVMLLSVLRLFYSSHDSFRMTLKSLNFMTLLVGSLLSVALAFVSFFMIGSLCIVCIGVYLMTFLALYFSYKDFKGEGSQMNLNVSRLLTPLVISLLVAFGGSYLIAQSVSKNYQSLPKEMLNLYVNAHFSAQDKKASINPNDGSPYIGPKDAKVTIVEYSDYQCPHCAKSSKIIPMLISAHSSDVRVVFKNYPIDPKCNPKAPPGGHAHACTAAKASLCVFKKKGLDAFLKTKKEIYHQQKKLNTSVIRNIVQAQSAMTIKELDQCLASSEINNMLAAQIAEAELIGIESTPSHFLNGRLFKGAMNRDVMNAVLKKHLKK